MIRKAKAMEVETLYRSVVDSPVGPLTLLVSARGARAIHFGAVPAAPGEIESATKTGTLARQLAAYFAGQLREFDVPLDWRGTAFQQRVWTALLEVPYGATTHYAGLAAAIGQPQACRAVGGANRRNPLPIVVPCHRVIGADGALVGYSGRSKLDIKAHLLALEKK